jgi:hypothetical protein
MRDPDGGWMSMTTSNFRVAEKMRPLAREIARASGEVVRLVGFRLREEIEEIAP